MHVARTTRPWLLRGLLVLVVALATESVDGDDIQLIQHGFDARVDVVEAAVAVTLGDEAAATLPATDDLIVRLDGVPMPLTSVRALDARARLVAFFVDHRRLAPSDRVRTLATLAAMAERRRASGDRIVVISHTDGLRYHGGVVDEPAALVRAFAAASKVPKRVGSLERERRRLRLAYQRGSVLDIEIAGFFARLRDDLRRSYDALAEVLAVLAGATQVHAGTDTVLVVASGDLHPGPEADFGNEFEHFEVPIAVGLIDSPIETDPSAFERLPFRYIAALPTLPPLLPTLPRGRAPTRLPSGLVEAANAAGIGVYPLIDQAWRGDDGSRGSRLLESAARTASLRTLAEASGGIVLRAGRRRQVVARFNDLMDQRHVVRFTLKSVIDDDRPRRLDVEHADTGDSLPVQRTLIVRSRGRTLAEQTLAALRLGLHRNPLGLEVDGLAPRPTGRGIVEWEIPLRFAREGIDQDTARWAVAEALELCVVVGEWGGRRSLPVVVEIDREAPLRLRARADAAELMLGLRAKSGGATSLVRVSLTDTASTELP